MKVVFVEEKTVQPQAEESPLPDDGLTQSHIKMVMENGNCSRNRAIRALRETNDDEVSAVMNVFEDEN